MKRTGTSDETSAQRRSRLFWIVLTVAVAGFTSYVIGRNLLHIWNVSRDMAALNREAEGYRASIEADSTLLERLQYDDYLEEFAREQYNMLRPGEELYIIEE